MLSVNLTFFEKQLDYGLVVRSSMLIYQLCVLFVAARTSLFPKYPITSGETSSDHSQ